MDGLPEIAIPSYKRSKSITTKTLMFLRRSNYPVDKILIFVANPDEKILYERDVPRHFYGRIVVGVEGLAFQRNFIMNYFPENTIYISMDDDVTRIDSPFLSFLEIVRNGFARLNTNYAGLFGILPNDDKRRYADHTSEHLNFIIGAFFMCKAHHDVEIPLSEKDDYFRTILYFKKYGKVLRYKGAGIKTAYMKNLGGLQEVGCRFEAQRLSVLTLVERYPGYAIRKDARGMPDILLNWRAKN